MKALGTRKRNDLTGRRLGFDWQQLATRLEVHGLWTPEIEDKLTIMETELWLIIQENEPTQEDEADATAT